MPVPSTNVGEGPEWGVMNSPIAKYMYNPAISIPDNRASHRTTAGKTDIRVSYDDNSPFFKCTQEHAVGGGWSSLMVAARRWRCGNDNGGSSVGPTVAVEIAPIENWLELEAGVTPTFALHSTEWDTDLLFKRPWTLTEKVEFMFGVCPV
jgi:phage-related tail fiber protein